GLNCGGTCLGSPGAANFACGPLSAGLNSGGAVGTCLTVPSTYVVRSIDVGRPLSFSITKGNLTTSVGPITPGPKGLEFLEVAAGNALNPTTGCPISTGANAAATPNQEILVLF